MAEGDGAAFGYLSDRLTPILRRTLYRMGLPEADVGDVAQNTMVSVWRSSSNFRGQSSVSSWACRIALNEAISILRRRQRPAGEAAAEAPDPELTVETNLRAARVRASVGRLPPNLRTVIVLREFEDQSYRTIAEILRIPIGTVMSRLHKARSRLRRDLADEVLSGE